MGMSVNALSNLSDPYIQALLTNALTGSNTTNSKTTNNPSIDSSSFTLPQDNSPQLSPFARLLTTMQQLQQSDPAKYQKVMSQVATNLQNAAKTATTNGNPTGAAELTKLADDFTSASQNSSLPNIQDLAQAVGRGREHHHHHGHVHRSSSNSADPSDAASSSSTGSGTSSADALSNAISAFPVNSVGPAQGGTPNPLTIINDTLTSAGISLSQ